MKHRRNSELEELEEQLRRAEAEEAAADVAQTDEYPDEDGYEDDFDGWLDDEMDEYGVPDDEDPSPLYQNYVNGYGRVPEEAVYADEVEEPDDRRESMNRRAVMKASGGRKRKKKRGCGCLTALLALALVIVGGLCLFVRPPRAEGEQRQRKRDTATILICGTDADGTRTDTMMLLYLSGSERKVNLLSLPRDTYTLTSSGKAAKLNSAYGRNGTGAEGMEVLLDYVRDIIGYRPDGYILLDFTMVPRIVDIMGGVDVEVPMDMDVDEIVLSKGYQHLSGDQVLALLRFRKGYATADLGRIQVQRAVMKAAMEQWLSPAHLVGAVKAVSLLENSSLSSLSTGNYLWVAKTLLLGMSDFRSDTLPGYADYRNKVSYYILEPEKVLELLNESYNPFRTSIPAGNLNIAG